MEALTMIGWVALGFVPTLVAMETAWRVSRRKIAPLEVRVR
jgi:hypothetical protein